MSEAVKFRHVVSIAGLVHEPPAPDVEAAGPNGNGDGKKKVKPPLRIANARVEIIVAEAPAAFQMMVDANKSDPAWRRRRERIDRTWSHADGIFYFLDLPPGEADERYRLRVSVPGMGTRYGTLETDPIRVEAHPEGQPVQVAWTEVELTPTRVHGMVTQVDAGGDELPIAGAKVRLRGESRFETTDDDGSYQLTQLVSGRPTLEVSAHMFETFTQQLALQAGQDEEVYVQLSPEEPSGD